MPQFLEFLEYSARQNSLTTVCMAMHHEEAMVANHPGDRTQILNQLLQQKLETDFGCGFSQNSETSMLSQLQQFGFNCYELTLIILELFSYFDDLKVTRWKEVAFLAEVNDATLTQFFLDHYDVFLTLSREVHLDVAQNEKFSVRFLQNWGAEVREVSRDLIWTLTVNLFLEYLKNNARTLPNFCQFKKIDFQKLWENFRDLVNPETYVEIDPWCYFVLQGIAQ